MMCPTFYYMAIVLQSNNQNQQLVEPVGKDTGTETADGVARNGNTRQITAFQTVHHGHMGA